MLSPSEQAARILAHYLRHLTLATGRKWTSHNDRDMALLGELLSLEEAESDTIPPYRPEPPQLDTRVTQTLDQRQWADFEQWRAWRREEGR